jgi:tRNA 2-thiocytidine biosynthesis protein TtcA
MSKENIRRKKLKKLCGISSKTCKEYNLIEPNDKILIGLSGGKDSLTLCEILADRKRHCNFPLDLYAIHVVATGVDYKVDEQYLKQFCENISIPLFIKTIAVDTTKNPEKKECFVCSWHRRKAIFSLARELNCNKIAFGHHADDVIETMLMNMIYHASISGLPAKLKLFNGEIELIRPMLEIIESDIKKFTSVAEYPSNIKSCPHEDDTKRNAIRTLIQQMEHLNPNLRKNLLRCPKKIFGEYLPGFKYAQ